MMAPSYGPQLQKTGHRVLLFSTMTALLTVLEDYLQWRQIKYLRLDGNTKADDRGDMLKQYNDPVCSQHVCSWCLGGDSLFIIGPGRAACRTRSTSSSC
jgi:hypothetical protein